MKRREKIIRWLVKEDIHRKEEVDDVDEYLIMLLTGLRVIYDENYDKMRHSTGEERKKYQRKETRLNKIGEHYRRFLGIYIADPDITERVGEKPRHYVNDNRVAKIETHEYTTGV